MDGKWVVYVFKRIESENSVLCILPPQYKIQSFFLEYYNSRRLFNKRFTNNFMYNLLTLDSMKTEEYGDLRKFRSYKKNDIKIVPMINNIGEDVKAVGKYLEGVLDMKVIRTFEIPI